jgi:hypothetical protein
MGSSSDYIVRIYRFEKDRPQSLIGLVETVGTRGKRAFNSYDELWEILNAVNDLTPRKGTKEPLRKKSQVRTHRYKEGRERIKKTRKMPQRRLPEAPT